MPMFPNPLNRLDQSLRSPPVTPSVFGNGVWNDDAQWNDNDIWKDAA